MEDKQRLVIPFGPQRKPWRETLSRIAVVPRDGALLVSPPSFDSLSADFNAPKDITPALYQVPSSGLPPVVYESAMEETHRVMQEGSRLMCGFMASTEYQCSTFMESPFPKVMGNAAVIPLL